MSIGSVRLSEGSSSNAGFCVVPSGGALGAEVRGVDLSATIDAAVIRQIHEAWLEHQFLWFRGQHLNHEQIVRFARRIGKPHDYAVFNTFDRSDVKLPELEVISNVVVDGQAKGSGGNADLAWHTDMSYLEHPASATINYGAKIPKDSTNTRFIDMYAAYEALTEEVKKKLVGLRSMHRSMSMGDHAPQADHPIVRTHDETGRKALFLGYQGSGGGILGLDAKESDALLGRLWAHIDRPQFVWEHVWQEGDLVIWDNRCLLHSRGRIVSNAPRVLNRVTIEGSRPV